MEAVDEACAGRSGDFDTEGTCGDAAIGGDGDRGAEAPDIGPPGAFGRHAQRAAAFVARGLPGAQRSHGQFAVAFVGVAVAAEICEQEVGCGQIGDGVCGEEGGQAVLPVLVAALDLALGLRGGRVAEGDIVEVESGTELGEGVGNAGEKEAVAMRDARASSFLRGAHPAWPPERQST